MNLEREEDLLVEQFNSGEISQSEYNEELRNLHREYRDMALESAQEAYETELDRW